MILMGVLTPSDVISLHLKLNDAGVNSRRQL